MLHLRDLNVGEPIKRRPNRSDHHDLFSALKSPSAIKRGPRATPEGRGFERANFHHIDGLIVTGQENKRVVGGSLTMHVSLPGISLHRLLYFSSVLRRHTTVQAPQMLGKHPVMVFHRN